MEESAEVKLRKDPVFLEEIERDLLNLSRETKKRFPRVREACDEGVAKIRDGKKNENAPSNFIVNQMLYPIVQGCETKDQKIVKMCIAMIQKLITHQIVDQKAARCITDSLWMLMESSKEEIKVLQSTTLLLTTSTVVRGDVLAKNLVLCFRLLTSRDATTANTAGATARQLVSLVFERLATEIEEKPLPEIPNDCVELDSRKKPKKTPPKGLPPIAADAFLLFQDLILLVGSEEPCWLTGVTELTRPFGLELIEMILAKFPKIFFKIPHFRFSLKEGVCALVIKLFPPSQKFRGPAGAHDDRPVFAVTVRLCRIVEILVHKYQEFLTTECEIFISVIEKFLHEDKSPWQRCLGLEVIHHWIADPAMVKTFYVSYELSEHFPNVFEAICDSLGAYIQSILITHAPHGVGDNGSNSHLPGFYARGNFYPLILQPGGTFRYNYMELLDKTEPPASIPASYGISLAYYCILDVVTSIGPASELFLKPDVQMRVRTRMVLSSWTGLSKSLNLLIESSTDEKTIEKLLEAMSSLISWCKTEDLDGPKEILITSMCRACLPPDYGSHVIKANAGGATHPHESQRSQAQQGQYNLQGYSLEGEYRRHVVAVGTPLSTLSMPSVEQQGPVMLTSKNLQCMKALLNLADEHGAVLGKNWLVVLNTLQHLVWILQLKPVAGGSLKATKTSGEPNAVITTAVNADLPALSRMLSKLFESSATLDETSLNYLIDALCQICRETVELVYSNREPSLFAVAKLLETGVTNLHRIEVFWKPVTEHLLKVCQHSHKRMREWGVEALAYLIKEALQHISNRKPSEDLKELQLQVLEPLSELNCIFPDVRLRQLDCLLYVLHLSGDTLTAGWPLVLNIIMNVAGTDSGEQPIRLAFQCLQLIVTDFLPVMPTKCLTDCIDTIAKFGCQVWELNTSLTAVGLMWNISDFLYQNYRQICISLDEDDSFLPFLGVGPSFDKLICCLFLKLGDLCLDLRSAVRKSASQTFFTTLNLHKRLIHSATYYSIVEEVLINLLAEIRVKLNQASSEVVDGERILIHHTRNTEEKQWFETQVMFLLGISKLLAPPIEDIQNPAQITQTKITFIGHLVDASLSPTDEVSLTAMNALQQLFVYKVIHGENVPVDYQELYESGWEAWLKIGMKRICCEGQLVLPPSQQYLASFIEVLKLLYPAIKYQFTKDNMRTMSNVLKAVLLIPPRRDKSVIAPVAPDVHVHIHNGILDSIEMIAESTVSDDKDLNHMKPMLPMIFQLLVNFCDVATTRKSNKWLSETELSLEQFVPFLERNIKMLEWLYETTADLPITSEHQVLHTLMEALGKVMSTKHKPATAKSGLWKTAAESFIHILNIGLPLMKQKKDDNFWSQLGEIMENFLFTRYEGNYYPEGAEDTDCLIVKLIREQVLEQHNNQVPDHFLLHVAVLLNMGSIHSMCQTDSSYSDSNLLREDLAKLCFETLLEFSLMRDDTTIGDVIDRAICPDDTLVGRLVGSSLLHRFKSVLQRFIEDDRATGRCPLPRYQIFEVSFVFRAIGHLIESLENAPPERVGAAVRKQLIDLYPLLVQCISATSVEIGPSLKDALMKYYVLLKQRE